MFVSGTGPYANLPDVEIWDETRDARLYQGPYPVIAHPPCSRWCRLAGLVEARWGHKKGHDDGCFESALQAVRTWGGVLEHPAFTDAFTTYGLTIPRPGAWQRTLCGGWVAHVEQGRYGHPAKKATWLYAYGISQLPSLDWSVIPARESQALVSWCGNHTSKFENRPRVGKAVACATPELFRDLLLQIARSTADVVAL